MMHHSMASHVSTCHYDVVELIFENEATQASSKRSNIK